MRSLAASQFFWPQLSPVRLLPMLVQRIPPWDCGVMLSSHLVSNATFSVHSANSAFRELCALCPFFDRHESPQSYIATWELLAESALLWTVQSMLPVAHRPNLHVCLRCDNAAPESAAWKGLSMARGLCHVLRQFSDMQRRFCICAHVEHVPGFLNDIADALSSSADPSSLGLLSEH